MDRRYFPGVLMYLAAFGVAFLSSAASITFIVLLALRLLVPEPASADSNS
jgi:hypothetical protein